MLGLVIAVLLWGHHFMAVIFQAETLFMTQDAEKSWCSPWRPCELQTVLVPVLIMCAPALHPASHVKTE